MEKSKLEEGIEDLKKAHGDFVVIQLHDRAIVGRERLSSGSIGLDRALGGGFAKGLLHEISGPESSGKTTLCIHAMVEAQKFGPVLLVDTEHSFDPSYAQNLGLDIDQLYVSQPDCAEQAFDVIEHLGDTGEISLIILDSIPALLPKSELEGDPGDSHMGLAARLNRQHLRRVIPIAARHDTTIIYVNQITYKIGVVFGNPETTAGGTGFRYFCSTRVDVRKISSLKEIQQTKGVRVRARVVKNKTAIPFQEAEFAIKFNKGISVAGEILELGTKQGVIDKSGTWYSYNSNRLGQGKENAIDLLQANPDMLNEIRSKLSEV